MTDDLFDDDADITSQQRALSATGDASLERIEATASKAVKSLRSWRAKKHALTPLGSIRVLIVDDNQSLLHAMRRFIRPLVDFIDIAPSVAAAQAACEKTAYDLLVVDYHLVNGKAPELIRNIRASSMRPLVYTILISGGITESQAENMTRESQAHAFVDKGAGFEKALVSAIHEGLAKTHLARESVGR